MCGFVIGSDEGVLYIRGEYPKSIEALNGSINELKKLGLLGENILGTDFSFDLGICIGQGAYICGEETALIASIEGRRAEVDVRPPFPVTEGLYKKPTVVNNVETLAAATGILINGSEKFSSIGNKKSAGTKLVCLDSFFNNPGVYEIDMGTPMKKIFNEIGGGYKEPLKAFQIGGPLGGVVPLSEMLGINDLAPEFTLKNTSKEDVSLSDFTDKTVVLAFYPGAFTGVCDAEMCALQDNLKSFNDLNAIVLGISVDSPWANGGFSKQYSLEIGRASCRERV